MIIIHVLDMKINNLIIFYPIIIKIVAGEKSKSLKMTVFKIYILFY
jgi:hypothetical protein